MPRLGLFYKACGDNDDIFTAIYDGARWEGDISISRQPGNISPRSGQAPGACLYNNRLLLAYGSQSDASIYMSVYDGSTWHGDARIGSAQGEVTPRTSRAPTLIVYKDTLYMIYAGDWDYVLHVSWFDGWRWQGDTPIVTNVGSTLKSNRQPAAVVFDDKLYLIYRSGKSTDSKLYVAWFDGQSWAGDMPIKEQGGGVDPWSDAAPAAAVFDRKLVLVYKGEATPDLFISRFDGSSWSGDGKLSGEPGGLHAQSDAGPSLMVLGNQLWLLYCGHRNRSVFASWFDGGSWAGDVSVSSLAGQVDPESDAAPALSAMPLPVLPVAAFPPDRDMDMHTKPMPSTEAPAGKTGMAMAMTMRARSAPVASSVAEDRPLADLETPICDISLMGSHDSAAINPWQWGFYACQFLTITRQLDAGVRVLDVRLKIKKTAEGYRFVTCHGPLSFNTTINEYQSFESLLVECKDFLVRKPSQFLVMSLKIDDWNGLNEAEEGPAVYNALRLQFSGNWFITDKSAVPTLREAQQKIYLINRMNRDPSLGVPMQFPDNTRGAWLDRTEYRRFDVFVQDRYEALQLVDPHQEKLDLFLAATRARNQRGQMLINFGSAIRPILRGVNIQRRLLAHLGPVANRPQWFGWSLFDYVGAPYSSDTYPNLSCADMIYAANTSYQRFPRPYVLDPNREL